MLVVSVIFGTPGVAAQAQAQNGSDAPSPPEVDTEIRFEDEVRVGEETAIRPVATVEETPVSADVSVDLTMSIDGEEIETQSFEERISNDTVVRREFTHTFESPGRKQVEFRGELSAQGKRVSGTISDEVDVLAEEDGEDTGEDTDGSTDGGESGSETPDDETSESRDNQEAKDENGSEEVDDDERNEGEGTETEGDVEEWEEGTDGTETGTETRSEERAEGEVSTGDSQESKDEPETEEGETEAAEQEDTDMKDDEETDENSEVPEKDGDEETVGESTETEDTGAEQREPLPGFTAAVALVALFAGALYTRYG